VEAKLFDEWKNEKFGKTNWWSLSQIRSLHL